MSEKFILSCESTVDLPYDYVTGRNISVLFYTYQIDGTEYVDNMGRDKKELERFYEFIKKGKVPTTSQINEYTYFDYFDNLLAKGDVLHIAFGSGMTPSVNNARKAAETLKEKYPDRKLIIVDSLCSCCGYGLIVDSVADYRDTGANLEETAKYAEENCTRICHQFFSTDIKYFKRSGRVSGPAATVASILGICPIMHLDLKGKIVAYDKARGKKNAVNATVNEILEQAGEEVCHAFVSITLTDDVEAFQPKERLEEKYDHILEIRIDNARTRKLLSDTEEQLAEVRPEEAFAMFFAEMNGREMTPEERELMRQVIAQEMEGDE